MLKRAAVVLSCAAALSPPAARNAVKNAPSAPKTALKEVHAAQTPASGRASQRLNAAALEEELKTNTPYWHDNRIHSFGNGVRLRALGGPSTRRTRAATRAEACAAAAIADRRARPAGRRCGPKACKTSSTSAAAAARRRAACGRVTAVDTSVHFLNVAGPHQHAAEARGLPGQRRETGLPSRRRAVLRAPRGAGRWYAPQGGATVSNWRPRHRPDEPSYAMVAGSRTSRYMKNIRRDIDAAKPSSRGRLVEDRATLCSSKDARCLRRTTSCRSAVSRPRPRIRTTPAAPPPSVEAAEAAVAALLSLFPPLSSTGLAVADTQPP